MLPITVLFTPLREQDKKPRRLQSTGQPPALANGSALTHQETWTTGILITHAAASLRCIGYVRLRARSRHSGEESMEGIPLVLGIILDEHPPDRRL